MKYRCRTMTLACLGATAGVPAAATVAGTCGFVAPCSVLPTRSIGDYPGAAIRMTASKEPEAAAPYSDLPANWRAPLQPPRPVETDTSKTQQEQVGEGQDTERSQVANVRSSAQILEEIERVGSAPAGDGSNVRRSFRKLDDPLDISKYQTESERRRSLPLSKLKRVKPKRRKRVQEEEGELRPLVPKTDRESVLRGEDYWIDYREVDEKAARREARMKAPAPDQFAQSKMRAEIANPYKQNWILAISLAFVAIAGFIKLNPGILDDAVITFPTEL